MNSYTDRYFVKEDSALFLVADVKYAQYHKKRPFLEECTRPIPKDHHSIYSPNLRSLETKKPQINIFFLLNENFSSSKHNAPDKSKLYRL